MSNGAPWTGADTVTLRRLAEGGMNDTEIGLKMHRHRVFIAQKRGEHGIQRGHSTGLAAVMARIKLRRTARRMA